MRGVNDVWNHMPEFIKAKGWLYLEFSSSFVELSCQADFEKAE